MGFSVSSIKYYIDGLTDIEAVLIDKGFKSYLVTVEDQQGFDFAQWMGFENFNIIINDKYQLMVKDLWPQQH